MRKRGEKFHINIEIVTRALHCFNQLHSIFYKNGVKVIPDKIYELLTPIALARGRAPRFVCEPMSRFTHKTHIIMGDGIAKSHGLILCTDSYSIQDVVRLINVLIVRYRFKCTLRNHSQKY